MNQINKMIGNIIGKPRARGGRRDLDGDGVSNRKDCQPRNTMRQDDCDECVYFDEDAGLRVNACKRSPNACKFKKRNKR